MRNSANPAPPNVIGHCVRSVCASVSSRCTHNSRPIHFNFNGFILFVLSNGECFSRSFGVFSSRVHLEKCIFSLCISLQYQNDAGPVYCAIITVSIESTNYIHSATIRSRDMKIIQNILFISRRRYAMDPSEPSASAPNTKLM